MATKGLEYDATVIVDPAGITAESPGGIHVLYVALTRPTQRLRVLTSGDLPAGLDTLPVDNAPPDTLPFA